jgi:hypothetical protein
MRAKREEAKGNFRYSLSDGHVAWSIACRSFENAVLVLLSWRFGESPGRANNCAAF